jgi:hypothetical protein
MKPNLLFIFIFLLTFSFFSCNHNDKEEKINTLQLNCDYATIQNFESICDTLFFEQLTMPDSVQFGTVTTLKREGDFTCLLSVNTNSLVCFKKNQFSYHLNRIGGGVGEYVTLHTFAIDTFKSELIVYDRSQFKVCYYDLSSGEFKREKKVQKWISNIEVLSSTSLVVTSDYGDEDYFQITDRNFGGPSASLQTEYPLITDAIFASSFSKSGSELYFVEPFNEVIYKVLPQTILPILKINFGKSVFPNKNWKSSDTESTEERLNKGEYAFMAHLLSVNENSVQFFHYFTPTSFHFVNHNLKTGKTIQLKNVSEEIKENFIPFPMATYQNTYLKPVYPDELDKSKAVAWWNKIGGWQKIPKQLEAKTILLLNYRLSQ